MESRPRVGIGVDPFMAASAIHAALSQDSRVEAILLPSGPAGRVQARTADLDAVIVSRQVVRPDALVVQLSPSGSVEILAGSTWRSVVYTGMENLAELVLEQLARRRHPATRRAARMAVAVS
ncbi:MAG: hypothetical protein WD770_04820 [Actinomycetota bacterium]